MINATQLLSDLTRQLKRLEDDLRQRISDLPDLKAALQAEWQAARDANRCAETFESWAEQLITQAGVHWLLSCVFVRFVEDNQLVERPWLSGTPDSGRLALARDRHASFFQAQPTAEERDYLQAIFREAGALPGLQTFFDEAHNPVFRFGISGDAAMALREFWQQIDPNTGALLHDFTDPDWNTRFLGDLYQDLSEATRKRYALLQTPEFVEEFILDRTLTPAIHEFGYKTVRLIDPTCGSGHFLLGGFERMVQEWLKREPGRNLRDIAQKALDAVAGVDLNPFAVAIARFRLLVAALKVADVHRLADAPNFKFKVAIGDSLLHGSRFGLTVTDDMFAERDHFADTGLAHAYASEDLTEVQAILGQQYHAVVGNPPYIVVKDTALSAAYRKRYGSCHRQYSLGCPFTERFFELAQTGKAGQRAGFIGLITTDSFMKREFGTKLIELVLPKLDLSHVVATSGASIPGHSTPTVILFGRHRPPMAGEVRAVMHKKGEPGTPEDPAQGLVWNEIVKYIDVDGFEGEFISVGNVPREVFSKHPWSLGGGGISDLFEIINESAQEKLGTLTSAIGRTTHTGEDGAFFVPSHWVARNNLEDFSLPLIEGENVRNFRIIGETQVLFPYDKASAEVRRDLPIALSRHFWMCRRILKERSDFGKFIEDRGLLWYEHSMFFPERYLSPLGIAFAFVATHNHFCLDRGGRAFNRPAPVIKLKEPELNEDRHLGLLGLLNSSVGGFWLRQECFTKDGRGEAWEQRKEFNGANVEGFPLRFERPIDISRKLDKAAQDLGVFQPSAVLGRDAAGLTAELLADAREKAFRLTLRMIAMQEELDWQCYSLYDLLPDGAIAADYQYNEEIEVALGERAFEIVLARRIAASGEPTSWFERHGSTPVTEIPAHWPEAYRTVVQRRIDLIERDRNIGLIERPEYKRRWNTPSWDELEQAALRSWLLDRLESPNFWPADENQPPQLRSVSRLSDAARSDADFMQIAELYAGRADFDLTALVAELVAGESVPFLPVQRYTDSGLRKRQQWEDTWALQRREDAGENVGSIPVPPKYQSKDFLKASFWSLRGGLDVPKERWVSYPACERGADPSLVIAWAGWSHLQQATAIATYYLDMKDNEGWEPARLQPLLAGLLELIPWLKQWHNEIDPVFGERMGDYYEGFLNDEVRGLGFTLDNLRAWRPAATTARRGRRRAVE